MESDVVARKETERTTLPRGEREREEKSERTNERCSAESETSRRESDVVGGTSMRRTGESSRREGKRDRWRAREKDGTARRKTQQKERRRRFEKEGLKKRGRYGALAREGSGVGSREKG